MPSQRVYIGNLGSDVRERDIEKFFKGFGKLGEISIKNGYGFVDFDDYRDADDAVHDLDGKDIRGVRFVSIFSSNDNVCFMFVLISSFPGKKVTPKYFFTE